MNTIAEDLKQRVSELVELEDLGTDRYRVVTPFTFGDGDHLSVLLRRGPGGWEMVDEGMTLMRLTYRIDADDLWRGNRAKIIADTLSRFDVTEADGQLTRNVRDDEFGEALYDFVQAVLKITDVEYLSREHVTSTFREDLENVISTSVPAGRLHTAWSDPQFDPDGKSPVDYLVDRDDRPVAIFGIPNNDKVRDATITLLQLEKWGRRVHSIGVFEDQEAITPRPLARFSDVADKLFASLAGDSGQRFRAYLHDIVAESNPATRDRSA